MNRVFYVYYMQIKKYFIKLVLNIYPPLLFNRIVLKEISDSFLEMKVTIKRSLFNMNFYKTIFGGSIFSACDPYFPTMYYHAFSKKKIKLIIWLKSAEINYIKPANTNLYLHFKITNDDFNQVEQKINSCGKTEIWHKVQAINKSGVICAEAKMLVYLSKKREIK